MGEREPRRHGSWGEVGGEGSLRRRHAGRDPGRPDPQAEPPSRAFGLGHEIGPPPPHPHREPQEELSRRLRRRWGLLDRAGSRGEGLGAPGAPTSPGRRGLPTASGPPQPRTGRPAKSTKVLSGLTNVSSFFSVVGSNAHCLTKYCAKILDKSVKSNRKSHL